MDILGYIQDKYVWIIIVGIVLIMTVIGYIAEKKDFSTSNKKQKEIKKNENIEKNESDLQTNQIDMSLPEVSEDLLDTNQEFSNDIIPEPNETVLDEFNTNSSEIDSNYDSSGELDNSEGMYNFDDDNNDTIVHNDSFVEKENVDNILPVQEQANSEEISFEDNSNELQENNFENDNNAVSKSYDSDLEIELPNIETLNEEIKDVIDEDDVWKF